MPFPLARELLGEVITTSVDIVDGQLLHFNIDIRHVSLMATFLAFQGVLALNQLARQYENELQSITIAGGSLATNHGDTTIGQALRRLLHPNIMTIVPPVERQTAYPKDAVATGNLMFQVRVEAHSVESSLSACTLLQMKPRGW